MGRCLRHTATARRGGPVEKALRAGRDVLFDIDWQGTQQLREKARDDLVSVFVLPPAVKELERRLKRRAQDSNDIIARAHGQGRGRDEPLAGIRLRHRQPREDRTPSPRCAPSSLRNG